MNTEQRVIKYSYKRICEECGREVILGNRCRANGCNGFTITVKVAFPGRAQFRELTVGTMEYKLFRWWLGRKQYFNTRMKLTSLKDEYLFAYLKEYQENPNR